jgi:hypothetical protein
MVVWAASARARVVAKLVGLGLLALLAATLADARRCGYFSDGCLPPIDGWERWASHTVMYGDSYRGPGVVANYAQYFRDRGSDISDVVGLFGTDNLTRRFREAWVNAEANAPRTTR